MADQQLDVLVICGSLRRGSYNAALARLLPSLAPPGLRLRPAPSFERFPIYNYDLQQAGGFPAEVEAWKARDPIPMYHERLLRLGVPEGDLSAIQQDVARRVDEATEFAKGGAHPGEEHLLTDVWADGGSAWRN